MDNNNTTSDENGPQENPNQTASRIRSNVYRVLMDRENDASGTQLNPEGTSQSSPPQELPEEKDSSSDDYEEESSDGQEDQMVALQIISQLLGIRPDMRHRYTSVCISDYTCIIMIINNSMKKCIYTVEPVKSGHIRDQAM